MSLMPTPRELCRAQRGYRGRLYSRGEPRGRCSRMQAAEVAWGLQGADLTPTKACLLQGCGWSWQVNSERLQESPRVALSVQGPRMGG